MTVRGKRGKTMKLFSHPSHSPWKSLRRFPHYHRHDYDEHEYLSEPVKTKTRRNDAQYHYPGGPNQMVKVGHAGIANSTPNDERPPAFQISSFLWIYWAGLELWRWELRCCPNS